MRARLVRGLTVAGGLAATLMLALLADASPRRQDEIPLPKPTKQHEALKADEGAWDAVIKASMPGPDGKVQEIESRGVEFNRLMPGGLWLISTFRGDFGGTPFNGHGVTGYDTKKNKYVGTWVDSFTTSIMMTEGTHDEATRTTTMIGDTVDEQGNQTQAKLEEVNKDDDHRVMTMYMKQGDDWVKAMEISYTRREGPPPGEFGKGAPGKGFRKKGFDRKKGEPKA